MKFQKFLVEKQKYCSICHKEKAVKMGMCQSCYNKYMKNNLHMKIPIIKSEYTEKDMKLSGSQYTICQVLRDIYWLTDNEKAKEKILLAYTMAKHMNKKLFEYSGKWDHEKGDIIWGKTVKEWEKEGKNHGGYVPK